MKKKHSNTVGNMYAQIERLEGRRLLANGLTTIDIGSTRYFVQSDSVNGAELWKSDLNGANASLVKNINPGAFNSNPYWFTEFDGKLIFTAASNSGGNDREPWVSDGTSGGTFRLKDIYSGSSGSAARDFQVFNGRVLFYATYSFGDPQHLYSTDGTTVGTKDLMGPTAGRTGKQHSISNVVTVDDHLVYEIFHIAPDQAELWRTDGTLDGTEQISGARIINRQLRVYGSNSADDISLTSSSGVTTVTIAGSDPVNFNDSEFDSMFITGLAGDDEISLDSSVTTIAQIYGEGGIDTLTSGNGGVVETQDGDLVDAQVLNPHVTVSGGRLIVEPTSNADTIRLSLNFGRIEVTINGVLTYHEAENLIGIDVAGSDGNDFIDLRYAGLPAKIFGGAGNDVIYGSAFADRVSGGDGKDWVSAGEGNDTLYGDAGDDRLFGDAGRDYLNGGAGTDFLRGGNGVDRIIATRAVDDYKSNKGDIFSLLNI